MTSEFSLEHIQSKPAVFDTTKLEWMNGQYLSAMDSAELLPAVRRQLDRMGVKTGERNLSPVIDAVKTRSRTVLHVAEQVAVRIDASRIVRDDKGTALAAKMGDRFAANLRLDHEALERIPDYDWLPPALEGALRTVAEANALKLGDVMQPVRVALTGGTVSEPVHELLAVVGRDESLRRIIAATS